MQRDVEKIEEIYDAHAKQRVEAILLLMAKDVECAQSPELPWGGHYTGHSGARQFFAARAEHLDARVLIERLTDAGDRVVAVGRILGKTRSTQLEFDVPVVHVWTFRDGQVSRLEACTDNPTMLATLGM
jgi:ketosteroid isomerase-like protein